MTTAAANRPETDNEPANTVRSEVLSSEQRRLLENHARFCTHADAAEDLLAKRRLDEAAMQVVLAARACVHTHAGLFASKRL